MADANVYDSDLMIRVASYINDLQDPEDVMTEGYDITSEIRVNSSIKEEEKVQLYRRKKFKEFLLDYLKQKFGKEKPDLSYQYCEKVYRNMYEKYMASGTTATTFMRVMYHPDVTVADHSFVRERINKFPRNLVLNQIGLFTGLTLMYYKTPYGRRLKKSIPRTMMVMGTVPIVGFLIQNYGNQWLLDRRVKRMGLLEKYNIKP